MRAIRPALLTLYAELLQQVQEITAPAGSVRTQRVKGKEYLKANTTVGAIRRTIHIGAATDPTAQLRAKAIGEEMERAKARRQMVGLLRRAGLPAPLPELGRILEALAAADLFHAGVVLVGTAAYQCYSPLVGAILPAASMMTQDLDIATASLTIAAPAEEPSIEDNEGREKATQSLEEILRRADPSFMALPGLTPNAPASRFRARSGFLVEVLVPQRSRADADPMPIPGLRAGGSPFQHLAWLIDGPSQAAALYGSGVFVRVPQPARYAVHKLILAQKRRSSDAVKRRKDLAQARALIEAMKGNDPHAIEDAMEDAKNQGERGWRKPIDRSLREIGPV
jgi:hypothetical protein